MQTKTLRTSEQVRAYAHITYRQLDYWTRQKWAHPADGRYPGSGTPRYYTAEEAQRIALMGQLVAAGLTPAHSYMLTQSGEYDADGIFRAKLHAHVYVEVFP